MTALEQLRDTLAIRDLLYRYARGVDRRDLTLVRACFAPDAYYEGTLATGTVADMLAALPGAMARHTNTLHVLGEPAVVFDAGRARSVTPAVAHHVLAEPPGRLRSVGVRYEDTLEPHAGAWWIVARRATRLWERVA